jgi:hypothetical protein
MGDYILMKKKFILLYLLLLALNLSSDELKWIDQQIEAIKPPREGISDSQISLLVDPFIFLKDIKIDVDTVLNPAAEEIYQSMEIAPKEVKTYVLDAIINKSALIDGKWYNIGDEIDEYRVFKITLTSVTLHKKGEDIVISTNNKNQNLKFKNK